MTVRKTLEKFIPQVYLLKASNKRNNLLPLGRHKKLQFSSKTLRNRIKETSEHLASNINNFTRRLKNKKRRKQKQ
jgi:hypothetical protein